jgi:hypothetical protein
LDELRFSLVHLDVDLYASNLAGLEFFIRVWYPVAQLSRTTWRGRFPIFSAKKGRRDRTADEASNACGMNPA